MWLVQTQKAISKRCEELKDHLDWRVRRRLWGTFSPRTTARIRTKGRSGQAFPYSGKVVKTSDGKARLQEIEGCLSSLSSFLGWTVKLWYSKYCHQMPSKAVQWGGQQTGSGGQAGVWLVSTLPLHALGTLGPGCLPHGASPQSRAAGAEYTAQ